MNFQNYNARKSNNFKFRYPSLSTKNVTLNINNSLDNNTPSSYQVYEQKLKNFLEGIKTNKIKYNSLKILFEYEDNFKLVCDIYQKYIKSKLELEVLNFYLKSLANFISLIHSDEPMSQLDRTLNTVNRYLRVKIYYKNNILFRIGDIGTKYYILLSGKAYNLVPRKYTKTMTFDQYRNHLKILYIFGEDYLLEKTLHSNIQSCDIAFSDIESEDNKILRNMYNNSYTCNFNKYLKIINGDEHVMIENYDMANSSDDDSIDDKDNENNENSNSNGNKDDNNNEDKANKDNNKKEENKENENEESNKTIKSLSNSDKNKEKPKKGKYHRILKYFNKNFRIKKRERNSNSSAYGQLDLINESIDKDENQSLNSENDNLFIIKKNLKNKLKGRNSKIINDFGDNNLEEINSFNIGIPKELLTKDKIHSSKYKYDGGELPTFFSREKSNQILYEINKKEEEEEIKKEDNNKNNNKNIFDDNRNNIRYHVLNIKRIFNIIGYENVATIISGMSFGEISLLNENHKRPSTIFIEEDSQIGRLNLGEYNSTIRAVRAKIRTDSINFLLSTKLFGDISYSYFLNKYWIYFQCKKIQKGDFLFKIGEECETVYIIYSGEIKLSSYVDKDNINELIKGIKHDKTKKISYYINKTQNNNMKNITNNSIFERKQKFCLMIGKKGDILGLNDIINYRNNKYICEAEVTSDNLSFYEINKNIIFNQFANSINNNSTNSTLNIENFHNIIKIKQEFMINKLNNIKTTIEQRYKYLKLDEEKMISENNKMKKINNLDNRKNFKLNKNKKSLSLNSFNIDNEKQNKFINFHHKEKQTISTSFLKNEKIKESLYNLIQSNQPLNKRKFSENINYTKTNKVLTLNKTSTNNSLNINNNINFNKTTDNSPMANNKINFKIKKNINHKNNIIINSNLTLDMSNIIKKSKISKIDNNINNLNHNNSINNTNENESNINVIKSSNFNLCKPYEFPNIHKEKNNAGNWDSFRKNKILKFLFFNESNNERLKLFKYYKIKKTSFKDNYFINTLKSNTLKSNKIIESDNIENNNFYIKKDKYHITKSIHSEKKNLNFKTEKNLLQPLKLSIKTGKNNYNSIKIKSKEGINNTINKKYSPINKRFIINNNSLINKNIKMNQSNEKTGNESPYINKYKKNSLLKNFYFTLNKKDNKTTNTMKITNNLLPYIERSKLK